MIKNKKTLARTSVGLFPPKFYHNEFKLSNEQEAAFVAIMLFIDAVAILFFILVVLEIIYLNK